MDNVQKVNWIFWEAAGLERGPLSLVRTTDELLEGRVAPPVQKTEINDLGNLLRWPRDTLYPLKLALTSPTSGGRSVGIVRSRTKAKEYSLITLFRNVQNAVEHLLNSLCLSVCVKRLDNRRMDFQEI
jgi:hypothetical protein